jgi:hypothetical protein
MASVWWAGATIAGVADPLLLYCISLVETGYYGADGRLRPYPWAIRFASGPVYPASRQLAERYLGDVGDTDDIDIGIMQVNWGQHRALVRSPVELLDPTTNVIVASSILREALDSAPTNLILGVGRYHSWDSSAAIAYGREVFDLYGSVAGRSGGTSCS